MLFKFSRETRSQELDCCHAKTNKDKTILSQAIEPIPSLHLFFKSLIFSRCLVNSSAIARLPEVRAEEKAAWALTRWRLVRLPSASRPSSPAATATHDWADMTADIIATPAARCYSVCRGEKQFKTSWSDFGVSLANITEC